MGTKISKYFTIEEMTASDYAVRNNIENIPNNQERSNLSILANVILDKIRELVGVTVVSSGFRCKKVNDGIGSGDYSQHPKGEAADLVFPCQDLKFIFDKIKNSTIQYDQLIFEFGRWIHVSYSANPRRECLIAYKENGKTVYKKV